MFYILLHPTFASFFFFFNDTATTEIYTLSLHDALPISAHVSGGVDEGRAVNHLSTTDAIISASTTSCPSTYPSPLDRKSTRLNSSHLVISYAVFCLKKKKK